MTGQVGQAPGVVKVRLSGATEDIVACITRLLGATSEGITVLDQSAPYPNRRDPGERVYLTVLVSSGGQR